MNPNIFRGYDIRGIADSDLTDSVVEDIGRAYGTYMRRSGGEAVAVGRDVRLSSERIRDHLVEGIRQTGCDVVDMGEIPTPVFYFSILHFNLDGGAQITGSHNPVEYNGFKVCKGPTSIYGEEIQKLKDIIEGGDFATGLGSLDERDPVMPYIEAVKSRIHLEKGLKVVIDAGNGTAGQIAQTIFRDLGCEVVPLYCEPDGNFPNHLPDPTIPEYVEDLRQTVLKTGADVGIGYDGDGDRIGAIDEQGEIVWGDKLLAIFSRDLLSRKLGSHIIFDVKCSQGLVEDIEAHGGVPVMWRTGHSLIKAKMKKESWLLGGEMSGHMFFAEDYFGYDDAIFASARLLQILSRTESKLSEIAATLPQYFSTPEIRVGCPDQEKFAVVEELKDHFRASHEVIEMDGARVLFGDGWGLVRASNTQPILVLRFEAKTEERLREIQKIIVEKLREYPSVSLEEPRNS